VAAAFFEWDFPELSVKILNNTERTLLVDEVVFNMSESVEDNRPVVVVVLGTYEGKAAFFNEGWGPVVDPLVRFNVKDPRNCMLDFPTPQDHLIQLQTFTDETEFSIKEYVSEAMIDSLKTCAKEVWLVCAGGHCTSSPDLRGVECLDARPREVCEKVSRQVSEGLLKNLIAEATRFSKDKTPLPIRYRRNCSKTPICLEGQLEFGGQTEQKGQVKFVTIVYLEIPEVGKGMPPSYTYDV